jgi:predicted lipid carrier protein YhbT
MNESHSQGHSQGRSLVPPLSPVLLAGLALRPVPPILLQPALDLVFSLMRRRHGGVFERLESLGDPVFLIDPVDLPLVFRLRPCGPGAGLELARNGDEEGASAAIRGPLLMLIDLLEGRLDGDALFFSRDLAVEGDTEAVLVLRNAVDADEIDLIADLLAPLGPFAGPARTLIERARALHGRMADDLEILGAAITAPAMRRLDGHAAELGALAEDGPAPARRAAKAQKA